jgi:hypothetical protein
MPNPTKTRGKNMSSYLFDTAHQNETLRDLAIRGARTELGELNVTNHLDITVMVTDGRLKQAWGIHNEGKFKRTLIHAALCILDHAPLDQVMVSYPTCLDGVWCLLFCSLNNRRWTTERAWLRGDLGGALSFGPLEEVELYKNPFQEIFNICFELQEEKRLKGEKT